MKRLLILKASCDILPCEIDHIGSIANLFGMQHDLVEIGAACEFQTKLYGKGGYDYVYLCAHANLWGFGDQESAHFIRWDDFADTLCGTQTFNSQSVLLLACCRGGMRSVAQRLFISCETIAYICGPRWTLTQDDLSVGFHIFLYNIEKRKEQPNMAACRASQGTGYDFFCYDRVEIDDAS
jgi:hypothetical protein